MPLLTDYTINPVEPGSRRCANEIEAERVKDGWECVFRTGLTNADGEITHTLHVWQKPAIFLFARQALKKG